MIADRHKIILPDIVSKNQSAFVSGCQITDNALIALENFHFTKHGFKGRRGSIAL